MRMKVGGGNIQDSSQKEMCLCQMRATENCQQSRITILFHFLHDVFENLKII